MVQPLNLQPALAGAKMSFGAFGAFSNILLPIQSGNLWWKWERKKRTQYKVEGKRKKERKKEKERKKGK